MKSLLFHGCGCWPAAVAMLILSGAAQASPITIFNTGVDGNGTPLIGGTTPDPHYTLIAIPGDLVTVRDIRVGTNAAWTAVGTLSAWIGPNATNLRGPAGSYEYQTIFNRSGFDPTTVRIIDRWVTDNTGSEILLNGGSTGNTASGFTSWTPFTINSGSVAGVNTLDFFVTNAGTASNPTSLRVEMTATTPEPASLLLIGAGLAAFGILRRRRV